MKANPLVLDQHLRVLLAAGGILTGRQLQVSTGKSQPSISLALARLGADVCKLGAARSTRYALTHGILGLPARQRLTRTSPEGLQEVFGELTHLNNGQVHVRSAQGAEWLSSAGGLPWFLEPLRPQGFLGRQLVRLRPDLSADPDAWSAEQVLYMATHHASDPPGAFSLGNEDLDRLVPQAPVPLDARATYYDTVASHIGTTLPTASSAGGEQPKFVTEINRGASYDGAQHDHLIVKFSPPRGTPFGERWHDLLHLEHLALTVLKENGIAVAQTQVVESAQRTYLESVRFDRMGQDGKRHVVAASAVHAEFVGGARQHWIATCEVLTERALLDVAQLHTVASTYLFGQFIGNTDMHFGNMSFFVDDVVSPTLVPTPVYDMLPMMWRPGIHSGALDANPLRMPTQSVGYAVQAQQARAWAIDFWSRAAELPALGAALRQASAASAASLRKLPL